MEGFTLPTADAEVPDVTLEDIQRMQGVLSLLQRLSGQAAAAQRAPSASTAAAGPSTAVQDPTALGGRGQSAIPPASAKVSD